MQKALRVLVGVVATLATLGILRCAQEPLRPAPAPDMAPHVGIVDMEVTGWDAQEQVVELTCPPRHIYTPITLRLKVKLSKTMKGEPILYRYAEFVSYKKEEIRVRLAFRTAPGKELLVWSRDDVSLVEIMIIQHFPAMK